MPSKICSKCKVEKDYSCFAKSWNNKGGVYSICKECVNDRHLSDEIRKQREEKAILIEQGLKYCPKCETNKPLDAFRKNKRTRDGFRAYCRDCENKLSREHDSRPEIKERRHNRDKLPDVVKRRREYRKTSEKFKFTQKKYEKSEKRKDGIRMYRKRVNKNLEMRLRCRIYDALIHNGGLKKQMHFIDLVGCSMEEFRKHIESQWDGEMSWDNYRHEGWHIDHIIPCKAFDLSDPIQQLACFNWRNCTPLWRHENFSKGAKYDTCEYEQYLSRFKSEYLSQNNSVSLSINLKQESYADRE